MNIDFEQATPADAEDLVKVQIAAFHDDARLYPWVEIGGPDDYDSVATPPSPSPPAHMTHAHST